MMCRLGFLVENITNMLEYFKDVDGEQLASFSKDDFQKGLKNDFLGSALFNDLQKLKRGKKRLHQKLKRGKKSHPFFFLHEKTKFSFPF